MKSKRLAVIGGGASGVIAAIEAKYIDEALEVTVFERLPRILKKLLATGNGRCNFTNENLSPSHFYGEAAFLRRILTSPHADTENYFRTLGLMSYNEDGRIYPRSQQAASVRDLLEAKLNDSAINVITDCAVTELRKKNNGFIVNGEYFDAVIVSGGGKAAPVHGSDGSAYKLLEGFGHKVTSLYPALCGLTTKDKCLNSLKGVRAEGNAALYSGNRLLGEESGEIQFTDKGISGIPVMNLSHLCKSNKALMLTIDFCEELTEDQIIEHINTVKSTAPHRECETVLSGLLNSKIGFVVMNKANIKAHTEIGSLSKGQIYTLCESIKGFTFTINGTRGFDTAQVTCGGINTDGINPATMMSKLAEGLFICGEIIDIHGDCGGYNLHLAWTTGRIAGNSAAEYIKAKD